MRVVKKLIASPEPGNTRIIVQYRHQNDGDDSLVIWDNGTFLTEAPIGGCRKIDDIDSVLHEDTEFMDSLYDLLGQAV